jgi:type II secretory pathway pseudopilin PulG
MQQQLDEVSTQHISFDPILPDTTILIGFGIIVILCAIAANVWANQVVPISRTKLAIAKQQNSNSTLRQYLNELLEIENNIVPNVDDDKNSPNPITLSTINELNNSIIVEGENELDDAITTNSNRTLYGDRALERWLFTDWLIKDSKIRKSGRQKEPAIPILKNAKWNSGDNPILVATTLILLGVLVTSVTERITTLMTQ